MNPFMECEMCNAEIPRNTCVFATQQELSMEKNTFFAVHAVLKFLKKRRNDKASMATLAEGVLCVD